MSTVQSYIMDDRECDQCGYNLKGLPEGSKCPECGKSIRKRTKRSAGTMSVEAPTRFVRKLQIGFVLASAAVIGLIGIPLLLVIFIVTGVFSWMLIYGAYGLLFLSPFLWVGGVWLITSKRPGQGVIVPDKVLDNDRYRLIVRLMSSAWPLYVLLTITIFFLNRATATPSQILTIPLLIVSFITGIIAWVGLLPTCVYFAEVAYWASHDYLAERLRSTAWAMAVFGTLSVLLTGIASAGIAPSSAAAFVNIFTILLSVLAVIVFLFTVIQLTSVMTWVIKHQDLAAGSQDRVLERINHDINSPGTVAAGMLCISCKYDLEGLPYGGSCPECGLSYAHLTPLPILDPAKMHSDRDETEIEIEEGQNKGIYFNDELDAYGKPRATGVPFTPTNLDIPDEGDIPLADAEPFEPDDPNHPDRPDQSD